MKQLLRLMAVITALALVLVILFSLYNFGIIGTKNLGIEQEKTAQATETPYLLYFHSEDCLLSKTNLLAMKNLQKDLVDEIVKTDFIYVNVEEDYELNYAWLKEVAVTPTLLMYDDKANLLAHFSGELDMSVVEEQMRQFYRVLPTK